MQQRKKDTSFYSRRLGRQLTSISIINVLVNFQLIHYSIPSVKCLNCFPSQFLRGVILEVIVMSKQQSNTQGLDLIRNKHYCELIETRMASSSADQ